ncbi:hypothetical protein L208DRAFT_1086261, partial [Tricholoma matsutake]
LKKGILECTVRYWLNCMDSRWTLEPSGEYINGHEQEDVIYYWQNILIHDELTFYAHDRCKRCWVHSSETATPQKKGKGVSLMVADF